MEASVTRARTLAEIYCGESNPRGEISRALLSCEARAQRLEEALRGMVEIAELTVGWFPAPPDADGPLIKARAALREGGGE